MQQQTHLTSNKIPRQPKKYGNRSCFARLKKNFILKCLTTTGVPEIEFIAVGIRLGAFDEKVYKQLQCGNLLKLWNATAGFIHELRRVSGRYTVFQDIEHLAHKWEKSPIKQIH